MTGKCGNTRYTMTTNNINTLNSNSAMRWHLHQTFVSVIFSFVRRPPNMTHPSHFRLWHNPSAQVRQGVPHTVNPVVSTLSTTMHTLHTTSPSTTSGSDLSQDVITLTMLFQPLPISVEFIKELPNLLQSLLHLLHLHPVGYCHLAVHLVHQPQVL